MSIPRFPVFLASFAVALSAPFLHAQTVNFEQASDLALFNTNFNGADRTNNFAFASGVGVGGSGGLTSTNLDTTAVYVGVGGVDNPTAIDLTTPKSVSLFFETTVATNDRPIQIGFLSLADASFNNDAGVTPATLTYGSVRAYIDGRVESQKRDLTVQPSTYGTTNNLLGTSAAASPDLVLGDYYKETYTMQITDVSTGAFTYSILLENFGPDGTSAPTTIFSSGPVNDTIRGTTFTGGQGFAAFRQIAGMPHLDNFSVVIPEPVSSSLLVLAGLGFLSARRRRF